MGFELNDVTPRLEDPFYGLKLSYGFNSFVSIFYWWKSVVKSIFLLL